jgi:hypothetical protein
MQAYKVKGRIDATGHLVVSDTVALAPGEVEVIVLQPSLVEAMLEGSTSAPESTKQVHCEIPRLKQWLEQSPPVPADYDPEQAKWEYLKEKHNL